MSNLGQLLSTRDVAAELGVSYRTVLRLVEQGELVPAAKGPGKTGGYMFDADYVRQMKQELAP